MGEVAQGLMAKLEGAGLTDADKLVLAVATGALSDGDDVVGSGPSMKH